MAASATSAPTPALTLRPWRCRFCGADVGDGVRVDDYLMLGGYATRRWEGRCRACGRMVRFCRADVIFQRLGLSSREG